MTDTTKRDMARSIVRDGAVGLKTTGSIDTYGIVDTIAGCQMKVYGVLDKAEFDIAIYDIREMLSGIGHRMLLVGYQRYEVKEA